jgi:2-oxoglutarate dehydrogenase complex dehydrogenase (E1) component-like enzyme
VAKSIEERFEESFKYGGNSQYLEQLYEDYIKDPSSLNQNGKNTLILFKMGKLI